MGLWPFLVEQGDAFQETILQGRSYITNIYESPFPPLSMFPSGLETTSISGISVIARAEDSGSISHPWD